MFKFRSLTVSPRVPENLEFLQTLANNLWWTWNPEAIALFRRINPRLYREVHQNPLLLLARLGQERLQELDQDASFLAHLRQVRERFESSVLQSQHWTKLGDPHRCIAYFSLEFGLHESVHIYSGGLGVLAGDHLKSASDLDLPIVGVGLLYREGYFEQQIDVHGQQKEVYPENDINYLPVSRALRPDGSPARISVPLPEGRLQATVWKLEVGRIPLFLLDSNIPENPPELRGVTGQLYGGDKVMRLRQEMLLGVGGLRALRELGYETAVCHMNEGHAAFLALERMGVLMRELGHDLEITHELTRRTSIFTTHTPVPAGNETFDIGLLTPYLKALEGEEKNAVPTSQTLAWGRAPGDDSSGELSMTILGLNCSYHSNGVAKLHGEVERAMWQHLWPDIPRDEVPIGHVTNGIHVPTWISPEVADMISRALGSDWENRLLDDETLQRIDRISDEELWRVHELNRMNLIRVAREHTEKRLRLRNASPQEIADARSILDQDALTIGFARRFATYKRATLILRDVNRLSKIIGNSHRPVQIIFAGKAHPADWYGKELIQKITQFSKNADIRGRIVFLENYDMYLARQLVRGVDVWLNTPRRPNEASGTSGMKVCANGGIHVSTLDGWWVEGYSEETGWAIGSTEPFTDEEYQDSVESQALYNILETEVIPKFYDRPTGEVPQRWVRMMKASMKMSLKMFSSHRMVSDYMTSAYKPAMRDHELFSANGGQLAVDTVNRRRAIASRWDTVHLGAPTTDRDISDVHVGDAFNVKVNVHLGEINPDDVKVEVFYGELSPTSDISNSRVQEMTIAEHLGNGDYVFTCTVHCRHAGRFGYTARVQPRGDEWRGLMPGYIAWADWKE